MQAIWNKKKRETLKYITESWKYRVSRIAHNISFNIGIKYIRLSGYSLMLKFIFSFFSQPFKSFIKSGQDFLLSPKCFTPRSAQAHGGHPDLLLVGGLGVSKGDWFEQNCWSCSDVSDQILEGWSTLWFVIMWHPRVGVACARTELGGSFCWTSDHPFRLSVRD